MREKTFREYRPEAEAWITLANGDYYPDILPAAARLYGPVLAQFGQLLREAHSSTNLFISISETLISGCAHSSAASSRST